MALMRPTYRRADEDVLRAEDPRVRGTELVALAAHRDSSVRAAVAARPDAPMASLIALAHERDKRILTALVNNPASPLWVLKKLATDHRGEIRESAERRLAASEHR